MRALRATLAIAILVAGGWTLWTYRAQLRERLVNRDVELPVAPTPSTAELPDAGPAPTLGGRAQFDPAGKEIEITLLYPPVAMYLGDEVEDADEYRAQVEELAGPGVVFDPHLSRAAREVAYQVGVLGGPPPEAVLSFLVHSSGAPELTTKQWFLHTTDESPEAMRDMLRQALASKMRGTGPIRVGVGEVYTPDERHTRHIAVMLTRRAYDIEPTPRVAPPNSEWVLRGTLPAGYRSPSCTVMWPDGSIGALEVEVHGRAFTLVVPTKADTGAMHVSISGTDATGPGKLLQLTVEVGDEPPRTLRTFVPEADPTFADHAASEAYALEVLNRDRARFGLPALVLDPALSDIARAHSEDMRDHRFFAHRSPRTGLPSDRLARAGYRARTHSENLALNDTIGESQHALMASIGHRRNILDPKFTHVGIGVARKVGANGDAQLHVTQLFAQPVETIDAEAVARELLATTNQQRAQAGAGSLARDPALEALALDGADEAASDAPLDELPQAIARRVRAVSDGGAGVSVQAAYGLDQLSVPDIALDAEARSIGIGVVQSDTDPQGRIGVVMIIGR